MVVSWNGKSPSHHGWKTKIWSTLDEKSGIHGCPVFRGNLQMGKCPTSFGIPTRRHFLNLVDHATVDRSERQGAICTFSSLVASTGWLKCTNNTPENLQNQATQKNRTTSNQHLSWVTWSLHLKYIVVMSCDVKFQTFYPLVFNGDNGKSTTNGGFSTAGAKRRRASPAILPPRVPQSFRPSQELCIAFCRPPNLTSNHRR